LGTAVNIDPELVIITNSVYPYHLHNVAVLSLPFSGTYHFRYEYRYLALTPGPLGSLIGKHGVVVLRDFNRGTFIPLREFRVLAVDDCGGFAYFDLEFLHFVNYATSVSELGRTRHQLEELRVERERYTAAIAPYVNAKGVENIPGYHLDKLVYRAREDNASKVAATPIEIAHAERGGDFTAAWLNVVNALGGLAIYEKACFYLINTAIELDTGKSAPTFRTSRRAGLMLRTGSVYLVHIYQVTGDRSVPPKPGFTMKMVGVNTHISVLRPEIRVDGAYDRLSFVVSVLPQPREKNQSELMVSCDQQMADPNDPTHSTPLHPTPLELQIVWPRYARFMKWVGFPLVVLAGAALYLSANWIADTLGLHDSGKYFVQLVGLSLLAIGAGNWSFLTGSFKSTQPGTRA
jgi:hypothetical protein